MEALSRQAQTMETIWPSNVHRVRGIVFCVECGQPLLGDTPKFCASCGASVPANSGHLVDPLTQRSDAVDAPLVTAPSPDASGFEGDSTSTPEVESSAPIDSPEPTPAPPGWYVGPFNKREKRWWSGERWNKSQWDTPEQAASVQAGTAPLPNAPEQVGVPLPSTVYESPPRQQSSTAVSNAAGLRWSTDAATGAPATTNVTTGKSSGNRKWALAAGGLALAVVAVLAVVASSTGGSSSGTAGASPAYQQGFHAAFDDWGYGSTFASSWPSVTAREFCESVWVLEVLRYGESYHREWVSGCASGLDQRMRDAGVSGYPAG